MLDRSALLDNPNFGHSTSGNLIERVIGIYLENTPRLLAAISDGLPAQTWPEVTRAAHSLKSSSATIGLHRVAAVAARIESLAREHDAAAVADELPGLQTECAQGIPELQAELARLSTGAPPP
ncbi:MAG TPA: Hpt domain-containing protein [Candidatus Accumulibacter phosphatis]|nr:Hpt domain-containing protein [Candidatus Accumulibacter phosphatis]